MFGKFDRLDRLVQAIIALAGIFALSNGLFMLADPFGWYDFVGTVKASGPANAHFLRDIGIAFIISGMLLGYAAINPVLRWGSAVVGNLWLTAHGVLHVYEVIAGICSPDIFWQEAPGTLGGPVATWFALAILFVRGRISYAPLPKPIFLRFARRITGASGAYLDDISTAGGFATESFQNAMVLTGHHYHTPSDFVHMARLGATRAEDCGPCVEIARKFALSQGMAAERVHNALTGKPDTEADALIFGFGAAISNADMTRAAELGDRIEAEFGRKVRTELTLAAASNRLFPAIKRGLGLASACTLPQAAET